MESKKSFREWLLEHITLHQFDDARAEAANAATHLLGVVLSVVALVLMVLKTTGTGDSNMLGAGIVFGLSMLTLYTSSSLYHMLQGPVIKRVMRVLDHASIYFLIAGTYTPVMLAIGTPAAAVILAVVWAMALGGLVVKLIFWGRFGFLHVAFYLLMGWTVVLIWEDVSTRIPLDFVWWALGGGLSYTLGTLVYAAKKLPYYHAIWHLFVLAGSVCFFMGVYLHLL